MTDPIAFVLAVLALLATPGPTNTLLATSGASAGFRRSLKLLPAEMAGYGISISVLALLLGPAISHRPIVQQGLRLACALGLVVIASGLWRSAKRHVEAGGAISMRAVFLTTLLNPKALIFAFVILPFGTAPDSPRIWPYAAALCGMIAAVGTGWISLGALMLARAPELASKGIVRRTGAIVLTGFAAILVFTVVSKWT